MEIGHFWKYKRVKLDQNSQFFPFFFLPQSSFFCGGSGEPDMPPVWYNWVISPCCFCLSLCTGVTGTDTGPLLVHLLVAVAVIYPLDFCKCQWKHLLSPVSTCRPLACLLVVVAVHVRWQSAGVCQFFFLHSLSLSEAPLFLLGHVIPDMEIHPLLWARMNFKKPQLRLCSGALYGNAARRRWIIHYPFQTEKSEKLTTRLSPRPPSSPAF